MRIHEDEKALEGLLQESPARSTTCAAYPGWDQSWPPWSSARSTASSASPRLRSFVATPGCVLPPTAAGQGFSRQTTTTLQQMAPLGLRRGRLGCHRLLGLLRGLLQTQASPWQEAQPRHPGHGASDGSNHLAALDAAPGLREPCSRPNTSEASLPSVSPAREAWPRKYTNRSKIRPISLEEDFPQPLQNNAGWSLSPKAWITHLLIGWRAGDLIVINGRGPARPAPQRSVVIPSSALQTHSA